MVENSGLDFDKTMSEHSLSASYESISLFGLLGRSFFFEDTFTV